MFNLLDRCEQITSDIRSRITRARSASNVWSVRLPQLDNYYGILLPPSKLIPKSRSRKSKSDSNLLRHNKSKKAPIGAIDQDEILEEIPIRPPRTRNIAADHHNLQYYRQGRVSRLEDFERRQYQRLNCTRNDFEGRSDDFVSMSYGFSAGVQNRVNNEERRMQTRNVTEVKPSSSSSGLQSIFKLFGKRTERKRQSNLVETNNPVQTSSSSARTSAVNGASPVQNNASVNGSSSSTADNSLNAGSSSNAVVPPDTVGSQRHNLSPKNTFSPSTSQQINQYNTRQPGLHRTTTLSSSDSSSDDSSSSSLTLNLSNQSLSSLSSENSLFSIATTGFSFVPVDIYQPDDEPLTQFDSRKRSSSRKYRGTDTDDREKRLIKKYKLFSTDTLRSSDIRNNNAPTLPSNQVVSVTRSVTKKSVAVASASSPPPPSKCKAQAPKPSTSSDLDLINGVLQGSDRAQTEPPVNRRNRRSVSDCSRDRRSGAYVHVPGKRRAPGIPVNSENDLNRFNTLTPRSTSTGRKKRRAPPPPYSTCLLDDKDIRALIEGRTPPSRMLATPSKMQPIESSFKPQDQPGPSKLNTLQKDFVLKNVSTAQQSPVRKPATTNPFGEPEPGTSGSNSRIKSLPRPEDYPTDLNPFEVDSTEDSAPETTIPESEAPKPKTTETLFSNNLTIDNGNYKFCKPESPKLGPLSLPEDLNARPSTPVSPLLSSRPWYKRPAEKEHSFIPFKKDFFLKTVDRKDKKYKGKKNGTEDLPEVGYCRNSLIGTIEHSSSGSKLNFLSHLRNRSNDGENHNGNRASNSKTNKEKRISGIPNISELDREAAEILGKGDNLTPAQQLILHQQKISQMNSLEDSDDEDRPRCARDLISKFESKNPTKVTVNPNYLSDKERRGSNSSSSDDRQKATSSPLAKRKDSSGSLTNTQIKIADSVFKSWLCPYCTLENPSWKIVCLACEKLKPCDNVKKYFGQSSSSSPVNEVAKENVEVKPSSRKTPTTSPDLGLRRAVLQKSLSNNVQNVEKEEVNEVKEVKDLKELSPQPSSLSDSSCSETRTTSPSASQTTGDPNSDSNLGDLEEKRKKLSSKEELEKEKERLREMIKAMNAKALTERYPIIGKPNHLPPNINVSHVEKNSTSDPKPSLETQKSTELQKPLEKQKASQEQKLNENLQTPILASTSLVQEIKAKETKHSKSLSITPESSKLAASSVQTKPSEDIKKSSAVQTPGGTLQLDLKPDPSQPTYANDSNIFLLTDSLKKPELPQKNIPSEPIPLSAKVNPNEKDSSSSDDYHVYEDIDDEPKQLNDLAAANISSKKEEAAADKAKFRRQFKTSKGLDSFKASLKFPQKALSASNTLVINKLLRNLENAIADGEFDQAATLAMELAKMKVALSVTRQKDRPLSANWENFEVNLHIEDKQGMSSFRRLIVFPLLTLKDLKDKVYVEFGFEGSRQQWIFFDQIATDETKTLFDYKVIEPDTDVYLYIQDQQPAVPDRSFKPKLAPVPEVYKSPYAEVRKAHRIEPITKTPASVIKTSSSLTPKPSTSTPKTSYTVNTESGNKKAPIAEVPEINDISVSLAKSLELEKEYKKFEAQVAVTGRLDLPQPVTKPHAVTKPQMKSESIQVKSLTSFGKTSAPVSPQLQTKPVITESEENILNISDSDNEETKKKLDLKNGDKTPKVGVVLPQNASPPTWTCRICTLINPEPNETCEACDFKRLPKPALQPPKTNSVPFTSNSGFQSNDQSNTTKNQLNSFINQSNSLNTQTNSSNNQSNTNINKANIQPNTSNNQSNNSNTQSNISNNQVAQNLMNGNSSKIKEPVPTPRKTIHTAVPSEIVQSLVTEKFTVRPTPIPGQNLPAQQSNDCEENLPTPTNIVMTAFVSPNISKVKYRGVDNYNPRAAYVFPTVAEALNSKAPIIKSVMLKNPDRFEADLVKPENNNRLSVCSTSSSTGGFLFPSTSGNTYLDLVNLETTGYITNLEPFECSICFVEYGKGEGAVLRECLHLFCKECLANTIEYCEEPEVKCPYIDKDYSCDCILQDREIRALVNSEIYEKHLSKSIRLAENRIENAFHCKTPNCRGWCIFEDNVNTFRCPVCRILNCLTCRAIHDGLDCKQYQERLKNNCDNNAEAKRTMEFLQEMVAKGEAINCPTCQVIVMKKWGCDWLKCSICKTEICWITRGPRWGPGGKGDTSSGCKCGVNGIKCHPKCNYCH